jgi:hypothetical protein
MGAGARIYLYRPMVDDFLPPNLLVDLVKIDVEGHEPAVTPRNGTHNSAITKDSDNP